MSDADWYMPNWEDNKTWEKQYNYELNYHSLKDQFKQNFPSPIALRDYCFDKAEKIFEDCNASDGWCTKCVRGKSWDGIKK